MLIVLGPLLLLGASALIAYASVRLERGSGDRLRARQREQPLAHELPYWEFLDDRGAGVAVNVDLTYSGFLELAGLDLDCVPNEGLNQTATGLASLLQLVPPGAVLQFQHWTDSDVIAAVERYRRNAAGAAEGSIARELVESKATFLSRSQGLRRSCLLLSVSLPTGSQGRPRSAFSFVRRHSSFTASEHEDSLRRLHLLREQVARGLTALGITSRALSASEVACIAYGLLNPRRVEAVPTPPPISSAGNGHETARERLLFSGIEEARSHLVLDGHLHRVLTLGSLPTTTQPALLEALLLGLPFHCRIALGVEALDPLRALDELKRRRDQAHLLATLRERRNQEAEAQEQDVGELIDQNLGSSIRVMRVSLSVVLRVPLAQAEAHATLERQTAEVLRVASSLAGLQLMIDELGQLDEFLATLPGNARHGRRWRQCTSDNAAHLVPVWQSWTGSRRPVVLVQNGRGNLVGLDPFEETLDNPNAFMAGTSGSGKSSTTNFLILNAAASGARVLVVDVGGSYRRTIGLFGGQYVALRADGEGCGLNPFFPHEAMAGIDGRLEERRVQFILAVVERMVCDAGRLELRNAERAVLQEAIAATYRATVGRTPLLEDLVGELRRFEAADPEDVRIATGLARDLRVWVEGPKARLVNRPSRIALNTGCAAFDLKGLETDAHLQAVVMVILSGIIWDLVMRDPVERKMVVFDEVWRLLEAPSSAQLIAELYRTSRKYRCSILTLSQSVEDFTSSTVAGALVNNSATVYLLRHRRGREVIARTFNLNPREEFVFGGLEMRRGEYTEALVLHGEHHFLARIVLSPLEYWIATTHPADLELERGFRARHPELSDLQVLTELARRHPRGAPPNRLDTASAA
jgi:hypothetical protein